MELTLEKSNWELCLAYLDDCIKDLQECQDRLKRTQENLGEIKESAEML